MMTSAEKIAYVQAMVDDPEATDALVSVYLTKAKGAIFNRMYPIGGKPESAIDVPERYEELQCDLAAAYFLRRGGQSETIHSENGIMRHYGSTNDEELLMEVTQVIRL